MHRDRAARPSSHQVERRQGRSSGAHHGFVSAGPYGRPNHKQETYVGCRRHGRHRHGFHEVCADSSVRPVSTRASFENSQPCGAAVTVFTQGGGLRSPLIDRDVDPPLVPAPAPRLHGAALAHGFLISRPTTTTPFSFSPSGLLASPSAFGFSAQAILICDAVVVVAGCESQLVV